MRHILMVKAIILQLHLGALIDWLDLRGNIHVKFQLSLYRIFMHDMFTAENISKNLFLRKSSKEFDNEIMQIQNFQYRAKYEVIIV